MQTKTLIATGAAGLATLTLAVAPAHAAAPKIADVDADLLGGDRLHLSAETKGATRVSFRIDGRTVSGRHTESDREDGTRDYERTTSAGNVKAGRRSIVVKACGADGCTTKTFRVTVEREDD